MNELSAIQIVDQINDVKSRVKGLYDSGKRIIYQIWGYNPTNTSNEYQMYFSGDRSKGENHNYERFAREIDSIFNNSSIAKIRVTLKDGRKKLGDTEIVIKPAYAAITPVIPVPIRAEPVHSQPQHIPQNQIANLLGLAFGLNGIEEDAFGGLGTVLAIRDQIKDNQYEQRSLNEKLQRYMEENAVLREKQKDYEAQIDGLNRQLDDSDERIGELEDELCEYEKINPKRDMISGLGGEMLSSLVAGVLKQTKYAGLLGFNEDSQIQETPGLQPAQAQTQPVTITPVDESPRAKAKQQIAGFLDKLSDDQFAGLYQLIHLFAKQPDAIACCLHWAASGAMQPAAGNAQGNTSDYDDNE
jgi:hypothetical protein